MMFSLLVSRVLGMLRDSVMFSQFPAGLTTDAYGTAFSIPDLIFMLIAGGGLSSAFIPVFSQYIHTDREDDAWNVFSVVTTVSATVVLGLITVAWVCAPAIASFISAGKPHLVNGVPVAVGPEYIDQVVAMSRIMLPAQFAFLIGSILLGTLYARHRLAAPGLAPNVYNTGIIVGAIAGPILGIGIFGMCWGVLFGAVVGNLIIPIAIMAKVHSRYRIDFRLKTPGVDKFFKLLLPVILGFSLPSVCGIITSYFANMQSEGIMSVLRTSNNLMQAPLGIFGHALALAAFPVLSQFFAQGQMNRYRDQMSKTLRTTIYLSFPAAAIMLAAAPEIVHVLYEHGKQIENVESNKQIAIALRIFSIGVVAWCVQPVLMRGFFSVQKTLKPVLLSTGMTILFILLCWANIHSGLGYKGLPLATNIAAILLAIVLYVALEREVGKLDRPRIFATFLLCLVAASAMGGFIYGVCWLLPIRKLSFFLSLGSFAFVVLVSVWIYFFLTKAFGMTETEYVSRAMARINRRVRPIAQEEASND